MDSAMKKYSKHSLLNIAMWKCVEIPQRTLNCTKDMLE